MEYGENSGIPTHYLGTRALFNPLLPVHGLPKLSHILFEVEASSQTPFCLLCVIPSLVGCSH